MGLSIGIIVHWPEEGKWDLSRYLEGRVNKLNILQPWRFSWPVINRLSRRFSYFYLPLVAFFQWRQMDVTVSWSLPAGIVYGLLNRLGSGKKPLHVICDFHFNPVRKDFAYRCRLFFTRLALKGIDVFLTTSGEECRRYAEEFGIARKRLFFLPLSPPGHYLSLPSLTPQDYLFAFGNSDRDYDTLVKAADGLKTPLVILCHNYRPSFPLPSWVTLISTPQTEEKLIEMIGKAKIVVLPLQDRGIAAGQTAMLEVMALGRPLIVTDNPATREYAVHGESAWFYEAGDVLQLRELIRNLFDQPEATEESGRQARRKIADTLWQSEAAFLDIIHQCARESNFPGGNFSEAG